MRSRPQPQSTEPKKLRWTVCIPRHLCTLFSQSRSLSSKNYHGEHRETLPDQVLEGVAGACSGGFHVASSPRLLVLADLSQRLAAGSVRPYQHDHSLGGGGVSGASGLLDIYSGAFQAPLRTDTALKSSTSDSEPQTDEPG